MQAVGIIFAILVVLSAIYFIVRAIYISFVDKYSVLIAVLNGANKKYDFYKLANYNQEHTYDNSNYFDMISEQDYLIYQLQFYSSKITEQIKLMNLNKVKYFEYLNTLQSIDTKGQYSRSTKGYIVGLLNYYEKKLYEKKLQTPATEYYVKVTLYLSKINGEKYAKKSRTFASTEILDLMKRLNNKSGTFYRDRDIWDALCRVERGKVSNKLRFAVYARDGYRCRRCHRHEGSVRLEVDHIIPISKGGKSTLDNLQTLCHDCNVEKGNRY